MDIFSIRLHRGDRQRIRGTFTHTQNEMIKTVGTCCLPFVFISGKKQSFAYALTKTSSTVRRYAYAPFSSKIFPFSVVSPGLRSSSIAMVCVTARCLSRYFNIKTNKYVYAPFSSKIYPLSVAVGASRFARSPWKTHCVLF